MKTLTAALLILSAVPLQAQDRGAWYRDAKLGMFIHWGLYSVSGRGEWVMTRDGVSPQEYSKTAKIWNPDVGCEKEWVDAAKAAGLKYIVLTTRHHDGFSLFDSKAKRAEGSGYFSVMSPAKRDHVRCFTDACRAAGIKIGFYYSLCDWRYREGGRTYPPENLPKMKKQAWDEIRQLMTDYGKIDILWYDGGHKPAGMTVAEYWDSAELNAMVRSLQPGILINDRAGTREDFGTIEGRNIVRPPKGGRDLWELCLTLQDDDWSFWGYCNNSFFRKTPEQMACMCLHCLELGGNLLMNVSPDGKGHLPPWQTDLLKKFGRWVDTHRDGIYATRPTPITAPVNTSNGWTGNSCSFFVRKGDVLYGFMHAWPGEETRYPFFRARVKKATFRGKPLAFEQDLDAHTLVLRGFPKEPPKDDWSPMFEVEIEDTTVRIADGDVACADIVIAGNATAVERSAAQELKTHLDKMTGCDFKIVTDTARRNGRYAIAVGRTSLTTLDAGSFAPRQWAWRFGPSHAEFIGFDGDGRVVKGVKRPGLGSTRGTKWAVLDFLSSECGVRHGSGEPLPKKRAIDVDFKERRGERPWREPSARFSGEVSRSAGWKLTTYTPDVFIDIPFDGPYDGDGWRVERGGFMLEKRPGDTGYVKILFDTKGPAGQWRLEVLDADGNALKDIVLELEASDGWRHEERVVLLDKDAAELRIPVDGARALRDFGFSGLSFYQAADEADIVYKSLPRLGFKPPADAFARLPRTLDSLKTDAPLKVVMLGGSVVRESSRALVSALVKRDFPSSKIVFYNAYDASSPKAYLDDALFARKVASVRPDLVIVGGDVGDASAAAEKTLAELTRRCKALGAETVCTSPVEGAAFWDVVKAAKGGCGALMARAFQMHWRAAITDFAPLAFDEPSARNGWHTGNYSRLESRLYLLPDRKPGKTDFYRMSFTGKVPRRTNAGPGRETWCGYIWVDVYDKDGIMLSDMNTLLSPSDGWKRYEAMFTLREDAAYCQLSLCSNVKGARFKDIRFERIDDREAAEWWDRLNETLPPLTVKPERGAFRFLPRTKEKLLKGEPLRIVMLGDSMMNDTYLGGFPALMRRSFPGTQCIISVRSSTGCTYYSVPEHFEAYVKAFKPDLLLIGGISHFCWQKQYGKTEDCMDRLLKLCADNRGEFESVVVTPPVSFEWRKSPDDTAFKGDELPNFKRDYMFRLGEKHGIAVWECTMGPGKAWAESRKPLNWFKRDGVHLNDNGKHLVARMLFNYFETVKEGE